MPADLAEAGVRIGRFATAVRPPLLRGYAGRLFRAVGRVRQPRIGGAEALDAREPLGERVVEVLVVRHHADAELADGAGVHPLLGVVRHGDDDERLAHHERFADGGEAAVHHQHVGLGGELGRVEHAPEVAASLRHEADGCCAADDVDAAVRGRALQVHRRAEARAGQHDEDALRGPLVSDGRQAGRTIGPIR